jgi:hypothetical protein
MLCAPRCGLAVGAHGLVFVIKQVFKDLAVMQTPGGSSRNAVATAKRQHRAWNKEFHEGRDGEMSPSNHFPGKSTPPLTFFN